MLTLNGKVLPYDKEFSIDGVIYPANWLRRSTILEKQNIGIIETPAPPWYDRRFYTGVNQPKDLQELQVRYIEEVKKKTNIQLSETDWQVVRSVDPTSEKQAIDPAVITLRQSIRSRSDEMETGVKAATSTEELAAYVTSEAYTNWFYVYVPVVEEDEVKPKVTVNGAITTDGFSGTYVDFGEDKVKPTDKKKKK